MRAGGDDLIYFMLFIIFLYTGLLFFLMLDSPDAQVIVFPSPAPVSVGKPIYLTKLVSGQCRDSSKITFVTQPVKKKKKSVGFKPSRFSSKLIKHTCLVSRTYLYPVAFRPTTKCLGWLSQTYRFRSFSGTRSTSWKMKQSQL